MPPQKPPLWKIIAGYSAFALFALLFSLYLTFPYDAVKDRVQQEADRNGLYVRMNLGPGLGGVSATNAQISKKAIGNEEKPPEPLIFKRITARPSLWPLGLSLSASAFGGSLSAKVGGLGDLKVRVFADELDFTQGNFKAFSGVDLAGKLSGELAIDIPRAAVGGSSRGKEPDLGQAQGTLSLKVEGTQVNGGTVKVALAAYGPEPTPIDLPKVALGEINGTAKFTKGQGPVEFTVKGDGLDVQATGNLKLAKRLEYSEPNVQVRLKSTPEFQKSLGVYGMGLSMLGSDPKDPNWRIGNLTGYLGRPNFR